MSTTSVTPQQDRVNKTLACIPSSVRTCLEIGFFDLAITRMLHARYESYSVDLPRAVGERGGLRLAFAGIQQLPFRDNSFDLVLCTEVLEHLDDVTLAMGASELARVARRFVLVTVPYKQRIQNELFKCRFCGFIGNTMGHVRSLDESVIRSLFPGLKLVHSRTVGEVTGYGPDWLYRVAQRFGSVWQSDYFDVEVGVCPACRRSDAASSPNPFGFVIERAIWRLERAARRRPMWIIALLEKT